MLVCGLFTSLLFPYGHDRCSEGETNNCGYIPAVLPQAQEQSDAARALQGIEQMLPCLICLLSRQ